MRNTFILPFKLITSPLFFLLFPNYSTFGGSQPPSGCYFPNQCNPGGPRISVSSSLTPKKRIQVFDIALLNLQSTPTQNAINATQSAISISNTDMNTISAPGKTWVEFLGLTNSFSMNIGTANNTNPQSWALPVDIMSFFKGASRQDFLDPNSIPIALQIAGSNRVTRQIYLDMDDRPMKVYEHYNINNSTIDHLGTSYDLTVGSDDNFDEPDYTFSDVPLDLNDSYSAIQEETDYTTNEILVKFETTNTVDAFGSISTPDGTFNCLRISHLLKKYTRPNTTAAYSLISTTNQITFITKEGFYFNGEVSATSGTVSITNASYRKVAATAILADGLDVKLNNDSKGVTINIDNDTAHPSAILDIKNDSLGILIPRIAKANRPSSPAIGLLVYQIDNTPGFYYFDGTTWRILASSPSARISSDESATSASLMEKIKNNIASIKKGKAQLANGVAFIRFDDPIENPESLNIQLQLEGDCNGIYISKKTREGFEVKELKKGKSDVVFSWTLNE